MTGHHPRRFAAVLTGVAGLTVAGAALTGPAAALPATGAPVAAAPVAAAAPAAAPVAAAPAAAAVDAGVAARSHYVTPAPVVPSVVVQPGDTLSSLKSRYHLSYRSIARWNGLAVNARAPLAADGLLRLAPAPAYPAFQSSTALPSAAQLRAYWRPGCPVASTDLRVVSVSYVGFDALPHTGTLLVNRSVTRATKAAFRALYAQRFPIESMTVDPVADAAGISNTASYNCRAVRGSTTTWSQHAYGLAIDINPTQNPQVKPGATVGAASRPYVNRSFYAAGVVHPTGAVAAMRAAGFYWGGAWRSQQDYMHFSTTNK